MLNINTVVNSEFFKGGFDQTMVADLISDEGFPYVLIKAYIRYRGNPEAMRRDDVNVEICRWASVVGVLHRDDFDISYVWHQLHDDFDELDALPF